MRRWKEPGLVQSLLLSTSRQLLLDTNAFIYFLTGLEPYYSMLVPVFRRVARNEAIIIVSVITESELLVRPERLGMPEAVEEITDLLSEDGILVVDVGRRIARRAAQLRAHSSLKLPDAIIVATAIQTACDAIVTSDAAWAKLTDIPLVHLDALISPT